MIAKLIVQGVVFRTVLMCVVVINVNMADVLTVLVNITAYLNIAVVCVLLDVIHLVITLAVLLDVLVHVKELVLVGVVEWANIPKDIQDSIENVIFKHFNELN